MIEKKKRTSWNKGLKGAQIGWLKGIKGRQPWHNTSGLNTGDPWNKGKKTGLIPKTAFKTGENSGENHYNWKGGYENKLMNNRKRRIKKLGNGGHHTLGDWITLKAQYNWTCPSCGKQEPVITLTEDHIIPITKGGSDNIENIQPLCGTCNAFKGIKIVKFNI